MDREWGNTKLKVLILGLREGSLVLPESVPKMHFELPDFFQTSLQPFQLF